MADPQAFWNKVAERYSRKAVHDEATYERKLAETLRFFPADARVLEFGCGTGATAIRHAAHVNHIDAIDIADNMLAIGRRNARQAGVANITFTRATLAEFNADESSLDAVLGLNVIHLLPDRQATIAEVARVLKPGGVFVSSTICLANSWLRSIRLAVPVLGKRLGLMPEIRVLSEDELVNEITWAGLAIERQWHHAKDGIAVFIIARKT